MREIKFRAWQPHHSLDRDPGMYQVNDIVWYDKPEPDIESELEGEKRLLTGEVFFKGFNSSEFLEDINLMQYTGLKDKNGTEIYEGDIVKILYTDWISQDEYEVLQVVYDISSFELMSKGKSLYPIYPGTHGWIEVIGNIYENPELLTA